MYRKRARIRRLESKMVRPCRKPNPRYHGTADVAAFLEDRTIEEMEAMEHASHVIASGGSVADIDPDTVALLDAWEAIEGGTQL